MKLVVCESDQVYVNGVFSGGSTNTAKFSLYVSPNIVANQDVRYIKYSYIGRESVVEKEISPKQY